MSNSDNIDNQEAVKLEACPWCGKLPWACPDTSYGVARVFCPDQNECEVAPFVDADLDAGETVEDAVRRWNTRTTPAKLDAPDNQEALAGEGVERSDGIRATDRVCAVCKAVVAAYPQGMCCHCHELPWPVDPARTLHSNEALDDRNGVEGLKLAGMLAEMDRLGKAGPYDAFQSTIEPERWYVGRGKVARFATEIGASGQMEAELVAEALNALPALLAALSRTPSSPQADEERVAVLRQLHDELSRWLEKGPDEQPHYANGMRPFSTGDLKAFVDAIATMTTRPAGGEEVEKSLRWIERHYADCDMNHVDFRVGAYSRALGALAALTKPAALPNLSGDAARLKEAIFPLYQYYYLNDCADRDGNLEVPVSDLKALVEAVDAMANEPAALPKEGEEAGSIAAALKGPTAKEHGHVLAMMLAGIPYYEGDDPRAHHYQRQRAALEYALSSLPVSGEVAKRCEHQIAGGRPSGPCSACGDRG